jgi:hypothetical protein
MKHLNHDMSTQDRIGLKLASRLSEATDSLPHDISERLRVARMQALSQNHLLVQTAMMPSLNSRDGTATLSWRGHGLWRRITALIPLLALIAGLIAMHLMETDNRAKELAEIDAAILTDDLPPSAYTDSGFTQFLKIHRDAAQ